MKILIADDDPTFRFLLQEILVKWDYEVIACKDGNEAWQVLQSEDAPRLAILDWMMPGLAGVDLCRKTRNELQHPYTYIILLTAQRLDEDLYTGMNAGADDYIIKPFKTNELKVRLRAGRRIIELQNELIAARELFQAKSAHDSLTGLWNHEEILRFLRLELSKAEREAHCVSVIMADLDFFKHINDTYGHLAGDSVLRLTAKRMLSLMRTYDFVGRYGGEEFLIILPGCGQSSTEYFAERLRAGIGNEPMETPDGRISVTLSLGIAVCNRDRRLDAEDLIRAADTALYQAKAQGRNRIEVADNSPRKSEVSGASPESDPAIAAPPTDKILLKTRLSGRSP